MADDLDFQDEDIANLVAATEREVFHDGIGTDEESNAQLVEDMSQVEGWDGRPLSDAEMVERTAHGNMSNGFDRPLELSDEFSARSENEQLRQQLAEKDQYIQNLVGQSPEVREGLEAQRQALRDELLDAALDQTKADQLIAHLSQAQQTIHEHNTNRVNASLASAHSRYGKAFEETYQSLTGMDRRAPLARELVNSVWNAAEPGEALMHLSDNPLLQTLNAHQGTPPPPFMPGSRSAPAPTYDDHEGYFEDPDVYADNSPGSEADVFAYAARR